MFGLFDWIWDLFYAISKSIFAIIDNMMACANMLCGMTPIRYSGTEMDFVSFLMRNPGITYAFTGAVLVAVVLVVLFGIFAIIRTTTSEKIEKTPAQIAVNIAKTMLIFLFIPAAMVILMWFTNTIMKVLYETTTGGSPDGLGRFLAGAFAQNGLKSGVSPNFYLDPDFNYSSTSNIKNYVDLSDYDFFFSYISGIVIIIAIGSALLMFVDRAISLVILFIFSPISLSTSVLDDGARFKLWRDQFLTKFLMGYGCIIAINIYALIIGAITDDKLVFFNNVILNNMMKILIIVGGGVSMNRVMALVGNLINAGAGSNELRDNAIATAGFRRAFGAGVGVMTAPFRATRSAINFTRDAANTGLGTTIGRRLGFKTDRDYALESAKLGGGRGSSGAANNKTNQIAGGNNPGGVQRLIAGNNPGGNGNNNGGGGGNNHGGNANNHNPGGNNPGGQMVNNAINNALNNQHKNPGGNKK